MGAGHDHASGGTNRRRLAIAFGVTSTIFVVEVVGAVITGSLALLVDAAHMLTDLIGLAMALVAANLVNRPASDRHTWGLRRAEILGAMAQAALLFGVGMFALVEGIRRLSEPPEIASGSLLVFGLIGLVANVISLLVLTAGRSDNLNMRAAFLEVLNDALGSIGVIVASILISAYGWYQADALVGIAIALLIVPRTVVLLKAAGSVLLETTPKGLELSQVREHILALPHVLDIHDLHASLINSTTPVLTAHIIVEDECFTDGHTAEMLSDLQRCVADHFDVSIDHSTFQIEPAGHRERERIHHD